MTEEQEKFSKWLSERRMDELDWIWHQVIDARHKRLMLDEPVQTTTPSTKQHDGQDNKKQPAFIDTDSMPWGKHRGKPMQDVPASYLAWCWFQDEGCRDLKVKNYIWNSRNALNPELPNDKQIKKYRE